jgi:DNA invertase Pin-like site-specific DNA recombinase
MKKKESEPGTGSGASVCPCAIYTRKSTEEGLNQPFNTLEAQRESAEAYILSHRHLGWSVVADHYDDGGYTGGNLERPALQKLLTDLKAGKIDCVVIYKVDRLSRSLLDFARLMEIFERHGVSLVSVTQPLNTTSSLGRLTLNILLSFAQFEREIIADRTRDKMSAARRKGKWVGGIPVLGYDVAAGGGKLVVNHEEARHVRAIFALYIELQSVEKLLVELQRRRWLNKRRRRRVGNSDAGHPFTKAGVVRLLGNVVYIGQVRFQGENYAGEQAGIIEQAVWRQAQELLSLERVGIPGRAGSDRRDGPAGAFAAQKASSERVPRIARLMALALKFEQMIREGVVHNYAVLAALGQVSRSRLTQVMNLLNLAPDIQEQILFLTWETAEQRGIHERSVRQLSSQLSWTEQRARWQVLSSPRNRWS